MKTTKLTAAQRDLLRTLARTGKYRTVPFLLSTEVNGTQFRTSEVIARAGLVEWKDGADEFGTPIFALWLTDAGRELVATGKCDHVDD